MAGGTDEEPPDVRTIAGEEGLKKIRGLNPRAIPSILEQARQLQDDRQKEKVRRAVALKERITAVRGRLQRLDDATRQRFAEELAGKCGKKLAKELVMVSEALEQLGAAELTRLKRAERGLDKVERKLSGIEEAGLKKVYKRLKRSGKALGKAV